MSTSIKAKIAPERVPKHVAIIMDGNGRWAKERGMERVFGHHKGVESVREMVEACSEIGVEYLTLYAFSTENWARPKKEVNALMELLVSTLRAEIAKLHENEVEVHTIGNTHELPTNCQKELKEATNQTRGNKGLKLILALSYSAKWDITQAAKTICENKHKNPDIEINEHAIKSNLSTCNFPDVELLIRTSGEHRISNFLLWELAYAELYFTPTHWPAFSKEHFFNAIIDYQKRERRFGKTSEQLKKDNNESF